MTRPDSVNDTGSTMSNASGNFVYYYVLNGIAGTYTVSATDGINSASTTFSESRYRLQGYTKLPHAGWTDGILKGWFECENVPYRLKMVEVENKTYVLSNYHDNELKGVLGIDYCTDFYVGYQNGSAAPSTQVTFSVSGPFYQKPVKIKEIYYTWNVMYTLEAVGKTYYLYWKAHLASGSSNWPGAKLHAKTDVTGAQDVPVAVPPAVLGEISGYKFNDLDGDGVWDVSEPVLTDGWTINLYMWDETTSEWVFQTSTTTDTNGYYSFTNLFYGDYKVTEDVKEGWTNTLSPAFPITLNDTNPTSENNNFGNKQIECTVVFYTVPSTVGSITFEGVTYTDGQSDTFLYGTSGLATANAPEGWEFDHWEVTGNVDVSSTTDNPTTVTVTCGGSLKAVFKQVTCTVTFYTDPSTVGSISFEGGTYTHGQSDIFTYGTSGLATANTPAGWEFDHWEVTGNIDISDPNTSPTTVTITCGGTLKAVFTQIQCTVTFYTDPSTVGSIAFEGGTYTNGQSNTFTYGTSGSATATAPEGWVFDHWETVGNVEVSSTTDNPTTVTITCGGSLKAVFRQIQCTVTFYIDPSTVGSISFEGGTYTDGQSDTFPYGTSGPATANAPTGWVFDHWEVTGNVDVSSTTDNPTTVTVTCGGSLKAVFKQVTCTVTFYTDPSTVGSISFEGGTYTHGQSDIFTYGTSGLATANTPAGWEFDHWEVTGNVVVSDPNANPTTVTVTCGGTLKAVFKQIMCTVTFYTDPSTVGSVTFEGVTYTNGQSDTFPYDTSGLATANAPTGWVFDHWETVGNVEVSSATANPTTFTITCGGNLTAVFRQIECTVTFYTGPSTVGSITFEGQTYTNGQSDTFTYDTSGLATATAPVGWVFDHWEVTGNVEISSATDNPTTVTVTCGGSLKAVFTRIMCTVTFYTEPSTVGSISFEGVTYTHGQSGTFTYGTSGLATANAPEGWQFDHWEATGNVAVSDPNTNPTSVTITCGGSLKAVFKEVPPPEYIGGEMILFKADKPSSIQGRVELTALFLAATVASIILIRRKKRRQ